MRRRTVLTSLPLALLAGCGSNAIVTVEPPRTPTVSPTGTPTITPTPAIVVAATIAVTPTPFSTATAVPNATATTIASPAIVAVSPNPTSPATSTITVAPISPSIAAGPQVVTVQVGGDPLNVRLAPDAASPVIALLGADTEVAVAGPDVTASDGVTRWVHVKAGSRDGYARGEFLSTPHPASGPIPAPIFLATPASAGQANVMPTATPPVSSATSAATTSAAFPTGKVGSTLVAANGIAITLNEYRDSIPGNKSYQPKAGNRYVGVDVTIENRGSQAQSFNEYYGTVRDTEGHQFNTGFGNVAPGPALNSGKNSPGDKARGWITFEIPNSAKVATFRYEPFSDARFIFNVR